MEKFSAVFRLRVEKNRKFDYIFTTNNKSLKTQKCYEKVCYSFSVALSPDAEKL